MCLHDGGHTRHVTQSQSTERQCAVSSDVTAPPVRPALQENSAPPRSGLHSAAHPPPASSRSLHGRLRGFHRAGGPPSGPADSAERVEAADTAAHRASSAVRRHCSRRTERSQHQTVRRHHATSGSRRVQNLTSGPPATGEVASRTGARVLIERRLACCGGCARVGVGV